MAKKSRKIQRNKMRKAETQRAESEIGASSQNQGNTNSTRSKEKPKTPQEAWGTKHRPVPPKVGWRLINPS